MRAGLFAGAAERLRVAKSEVKARLNSGSTGPPSTPPSPAVTNRGSGNLWATSAPEVDISTVMHPVACNCQLK